MGAYLATYPADASSPNNGKVRLLYETAPMAVVSGGTKQAVGFVLAVTGKYRIMDLLYLQRASINAFLVLSWAAETM
jgi:fructose-1,6-bisphosphatase